MCTLCKCPLVLNAFLTPPPHSRPFNFLLIVLLGCPPPFPPNHHLPPSRPPSTLPWWEQFPVGNMQTPQSRRTRTWSRTGNTRPLLSICWDRSDMYDARVTCMHVAPLPTCMQNDNKKKKTCRNVFFFFFLVAEDKPKWKERSVAASVPFMITSLSKIWLNVASTKHCCDANDTN